MIEFPITLTSGGSVCLPGHAFALALGYTKNQGVYRLHIDATGEWEGLTIRAFWHVPDGKDPVSSLVADGYVAVPASVTAQPGNGCVTFEGSDGTRTVTSADLRYRVAANSGTDDGSMPEPGTPAWQELVGAVHTDATAAEQAKTDAQTAATESAASAEKAAASKKAAEDAKAKAAESLQELKNGIASGNFKGDPGVSPTVTVQDITGGHRIVITDETGTSSVDVLNGKQGDPGKPGDTGATPELTIGTVKEGDAPSATITGTVKKPILNLTLKSGAPGKDATVDATLTQSGQAADAKVTGDAISAVKARQNILTGTETGNPLSVDDAFPAPLCGLTVYGRSTQDGTPTPDAPVPIVSAGDGGSVAVKVTGKNRMPSNLRHREFGECFVKKNTFITLVFKDGFVSKGGNILFIGENNENLWFGIDANKAEHHITLKANATKFQYLLNDTASENVCLTWNASSPDYEPYREQLLTLPTPNGLPGIPVTSGGNYTDQSGQQWVCDEVDLERGVKVQRIYKVDVDGENVKFEQAGDYANLVPRGLPIALYANGQKTYAISTFTSLSWFFNTVNGQFLYLIAANLADQLNASCKKQPGKVYYALATPIETPLTATELAAYKALTAYGPDTVVQAGDGAGIKLGYQRDVNITIKKLEDAIASMTTT